MVDQRIRLDEIVDGQSITVDPVTGKLRSTPINTVATGIGILTPTRFFARPSGVAQDNAGVPVLTAHQVMLGHGAEFTLPMFDPVTGAASAVTGVGWTTGDVYVAFQAAVTACAAGGGGTVQLPGGHLTCSAEIVVPSVSGGPIGVSGVLIRGKGNWCTSIAFPANTSGIRFNGTNAAAIYGGGVEDLMLYGGGGASAVTGLTVKVCLFTHFRNVWIRNFGSAGSGARGMSFLTDGPGPCQDIYMSNVHVQLNDVGMYIDDLNQFTFVNCMWNQNITDGLVIKGCIGQISGALFQGGSARTLHLSPKTGNSIELTLVGRLYFETTTAFAPILADEGPASTSGGTLTLIGGLLAQGGGASPPLIDVTRYRLSLGGTVTAVGWDVHLRGRSLDSLSVTDAAWKSGRFDLDGASRRHAVFMGSGALAVGAAEPAKRGFQVRLCGSDGSSWDQLNNFVALLAGGTGRKLRACWHAGFGVELKDSGGAYFPDIWRDQVNGYAMTAANLLDYKADGSNYRGQPCMHCVSAAGQNLLGSAFSPAIVLLGETPEIFAVGRYTANANGASLFGLGTAFDFGVSDSATNFLGRYAANGINGPVFDTLQHRWRLRSDGATTSDLVLDDTVYNLAAGATAASDMTAISAGKRPGGTNAADVTLGCLIVFGEPLTTAEAAFVKRLLVRDFG